MAPMAAIAQVDPATQSLINQLRFTDRTRGMVRPQSTSVAPEPATSAAIGIPAPQQAPAAQAPAAPRPAAARPAAPAPAPATTAPAGVPAVSIRVEFAMGSATLTPRAVSQLNALGAALTSEVLANDRFRIEGHTDTVGSADENRLLSERRAIAVRDYLMERFAISGDRLVTEGMGETRLLVQTPDETANLQNRRVQVLNLGS